MHISRAELLDRLQNVSVQPGQRYQHYKTKGQYSVINIVILEATDELAVLYADDAHPELKWVRSYDDFVAEVAPHQPRFKLLA